MCYYNIKTACLDTTVLYLHVSCKKSYNHKALEIFVLKNYVLIENGKKNTLNV